MGQQCYFIGLNLAQASEYTALAVLERPVVRPRDQGQQRRPPYSLRHLKRFPVGTHYSVVAAAVRELLNTPPLSNCVLVVDQTGVGSSVMKLFEDDWMRRIICTFFPVTITAGQEAVVGPSGDLQIPKKELVGVLQVLLQKAASPGGTYAPGCRPTRQRAGEFPHDRVDHEGRFVRVVA